MADYVCLEDRLLAYYTVSEDWLNLERQGINFIMKWCLLVVFVWLCWEINWANWGLLLLVLVGCWICYPLFDWDSWTQFPFFRRRCIVFGISFHLHNFLLRCWGFLFFGLNGCMFQWIRDRICLVDRFDVIQHKLIGLGNSWCEYSFLILQWELCEGLFDYFVQWYLDGGDSTVMESWDSWSTGHGIQINWFIIICIWTINRNNQDDNLLTPLKFLIIKWIEYVIISGESVSGRDLSMFFLRLPLSQSWLPLSSLKLNSSTLHTTSVRNYKPCIMKISVYPQPIIWKLCFSPTKSFWIHMPIKLGSSPLHLTILPIIPTNIHLINLPLIPKTAALSRPALKTIMLPAYTTIMRIKYILRLRSSMCCCLPCSFITSNMFKGSTWYITTILQTMWQLSDHTLLLRLLSTT